MGSSFNCLENVFYCPWNDTLLLALSSLHGVSFTGTRLPISEYCAVVSFKYWLNDRKSCILKDWLLFAGWREYRVESKISHSWLIWLLRIRIFDCDSSFLLKDLNNNLMFLLDFFFTWRSASDNDFDSLSFGTCFDFRRHIKVLTWEKLF